MNNYKFMEFKRKKQSPLRSLMAEANKSVYKGINSLEKARKTKNSYLIMEGDDGGQIYVVCPVKLIQCDKKRIEQLLEEVDKTQWDDLSMAGFYYEIHDPGSVVSGGMGGGMAENDLWVHERLGKYYEKIRDVLTGASNSLA